MARKSAKATNQNKEFFEAIALLEQERGIPADYLLEKVCAEHPEDYHLINDLVSLQKSKTILMNNNGLQGDIEKRLDNYLNQQ